MDADAGRNDQEYVDYADLDDPISDESSFYGDEETKAQLEDKGAAFDPQHHWDHVQENQLYVIRQRALEREMALAAEVHAEAVPKGLTSQSAVKPEVYNHCQTDRSSLRANESIDTFLARLPPCTMNSHGARIRIERPASDTVHGHDNQLDSFKQTANRTLQSLSQSLAEFNDSSKARETAKTEILSAARDAGIKSGKWIFWSPVKHVNDLWSLVAKETLTNQLGTAAEVMIADARKGDEQRLIVVHTADFDNIEEISRVLKALVDLIKSEGLMTKVAQLFYKPEAYSVLGIRTRNKWGLQASLHSRRGIQEWQREKDRADGGYLSDGR